MFARHRALCKLIYLSEAASALLARSPSPPFVAVHYTPFCPFCKLYLARSAFLFWGGFTFPPSRHPLGESLGMTWQTAKLAPVSLSCSYAIFIVAFGKVCLETEYASCAMALGRML